MELSAEMECPAVFLSQKAHNLTSGQHVCFLSNSGKKKKKKSLSQGLMFHFPIDLDAGITRDPGEHLKAN